MAAGATEVVNIGIALSAAAYSVLIENTNCATYDVRHCGDDPISMNMQDRI